MEVSFEGLSCTASLSGKLLLDNVSGQFQTGELTAILGPSGAGKTTLLNAISGYRRRGVKGQITAGQKQSRCYIGQEDLLAPFLTAGEQMDFASRLKLPSNFTGKQRTAIVDELQDILGLDECTDTRTERLSGGQRKRLAIALELINNPPIVFLDEPTSGLDMSSARLLVQMLSTLSQSGRTIIITIHQPSAKLFDLFDRVYFLAAGRCVYQGGPGAHLVDLLARYQFVCPRHYNPADYLIEVIEDKKNIDILSRALDNGKACWYSEKVQQKTLSIQEQNSEKKCILLMGLTEDSRGCCASFWHQFFLIRQRIALQTSRNKIVPTIQFLTYLLCALVISALFQNAANNGTKMHSTLNLCMTVVLFISYSEQMSPVVYYPFQVKLLKKEHFNQWYSLFPYYLAFKISKVPYLVFLILMFTCLVFGMSGIPWELDRFVIFFAVNVITSFVAEAFGLTIGSLFNVTNGSALGCMGLASAVGLASYGYDFMRSIPDFMKIVVRGSYMRSAVYALGLTVFGMDRQRLDCPEEAIHCHFREPKVVLHFLDLEGVTVWRFIGDLIGNLFFFWLTFYFALKWRLRH